MNPECQSTEIKGLLDRELHFAMVVSSGILDTEANVDASDEGDSKESLSCKSL